ncbi:MAG: hypothetical protein ABI625_13435 [bacterium]
MKLCHPERAERVEGSVLVVALLCLLSSTALAQPAPYHTYRTLDTPHFHVHVPVGLEREGRVAGAAAERAYAQLARELSEPRGPIDLVVTDDADYSNGFATPVPTNRIVVFATPPVDAGSLRLNEDWLSLVITHELTHIFHLDRVRGLWSVAQHVFGRAPALFPNQYGPSWLTEGLAVYYESRLTPGGRLKDAESRMIARAAALEHRVPTLNALSLGSPIFPGGTGAYGYGSLFVDYLSRTRGDTTIRRFIDVQSATLIPWALNHEAADAFGITFQSAFDAFRDSVQRSVGDVGAAELRSPLRGWRELTTHGYYAQDPRWLSDSTIVYAGSDGRSTAAEFRLSLDGTRQRTGRRSSLGPSVPFGGDGLLFAQIEYASSYEARSDLYVERNGRQHRLTNGLRLIQPDARRDGTIVAVQVAPGRASLMLLDSTARTHRLFRTADADETWSEPRWSPDGSAIAVSHRTHGGTFSLEVLDVATGAARVVDRGAFLISSPSWARDGRSVLYTSEESGVPELTIADLDGGKRIPDCGCCHPERAERVEGSAPGIHCAETGLYMAELSPSGNSMAAVSLRADGYHVGVAPALLTTSTVSPSNVRNAPVIDTQPLALGDYHAYSAWRSVLPQYWYPVIEAAPGRGTRLGFTTSGHDVVYRHLYDGGATLPTTGAYPAANINYRYAGFRRPFVDVSLLQDYTLERTLANGGTTNTVGSLLRRVQFGSLALTFVRPRVRTYSAISFGGSVEHRDFRTDPGELFKQINDTTYTSKQIFPGAFASVQWSNLQRPSLSISPEDGVSVAITGRARTDTRAVSDNMSTSVVGTASGFKSLDLPGFAHHVLALRLAGGVADHRTSSSFQIGGTSGSAIQVVPGYSVGEGRRTFGVRGFPAATAYGTSAAGATLEYRAPLALGGQGIGSLPFFFNRASVTAFADAATTSCVRAPLYSNACSSSPVIGRTIASAGGEIVLSAAILDWDTPQNLRFGVAAPVAGREFASNPASVYLAYGLSF